MWHKNMASGGLGGAITRRHDSSSVSASYSLLNRKGNDASTSSSSSFPLTWRARFGSGGGASSRGGGGGRGVVFQSLKSVKVSLAVYLGMGLVAAIMMVLYEHGFLLFKRSPGFGEGPICGRQVGASAAPDIAEKTLKDLETMTLSSLVQDHIHKYRPAIFRGGLSAETLADVQRGLSDKHMIDVVHAVSDGLLNVEQDKVENRTAGSVETNVEEFVKEYQKQGWYAVQDLPYKTIMKHEAFENFTVPRAIAELIRHGDGLETLEYPLMNLWWSGGGTKSVIHWDEWLNLNFCITGKKTFYLADPSFIDDLYFSKIATWLGWEDKDMEAAPWLVQYDKAYSPVKFYDPNLERYPRFKNVKWTRVDMNPGDILFLPRYMLHYVEVPEKTRSISVNMFMEEDVWMGNILGLRSGCFGAIEVLGFVPRSLVQMVKDIYFWRASYFTTFIMLFPAHIFQYIPFSVFVDLWCRNGVAQSWDEFMHSDRIKQNIFDEPFVRLDGIQKEPYIERCIQTRTNKMHALVGACMLVGAMLAFVASSLGFISPGRSKGLMT